MNISQSVDFVQKSSNSLNFVFGPENISLFQLDLLQPVGLQLGERAFVLLCNMNMHDLHRAFTFSDYTVSATGSKFLRCKTQIS